MTQRHNFRNSLAKPKKKPSRRLFHETLEKRELLAAELGLSTTGPQLIALAANQGDSFDLENNNVLKFAPTELTFRFDGGQQLDETTLSAISFTAAGGDGSFSEGNELPVVPGYLGFQDENGTRIVVARFAETLADDQYLVQIAGFDDTNPSNPVVGLRNSLRELFTPPDPLNASRPFQDIRFEVEVGPKVVAVVPQPIEGVGSARQQLRDTIFVYFNNDPLSNPTGGVVSSTSGSTLPVVNRNFYQLIFNQSTVENTDDAIYKPKSVDYDPLLNRAKLVFDKDLSELSDVGTKLGPASTLGAGTFRLRVGSGEALPSAPQLISGGADAGDVFPNAMPLGVALGAGTQSVVVSDGLIKSTNDIIPSWPGASDVTGLRNQRRDAEVVGRFDTNTGVDIFKYNFANRYGVDPQNNPLDNAITPAQKQRAREVLDLYALKLGVQFIETADEGLQIVTGDIRAIADSADTGAGDTPYSLFRVNDADPTKGVLIMDAGENWYDGYGLTDPNDPRPSWFEEAVRGIGSLMGIGSLFHLPPGVGAGGNSPDEGNSLSTTDPYPVLPLEPDFLSQSDVTLGQALHRPESDDIDFYSFTVTEDGQLNAETFAQRLEDGSMLDTHLKLFKKQSDGSYELVASNGDFYGNDSFVGIDIVLDRDSSGAKVPAVYVLGVSSVGNEGYNGAVANSGLGGRTEGQYQMRVTFVGQSGSTITDTNGSRLDGDADGLEGGDFNFWFRVARDTAVPSVDEPRVIFVSKDGGDPSNTGTLNSPLRDINSAFSKARPFDIVRLLPSAGADGLISTVADNLAYEIGVHPSVGALSDGTSFKVPKGVTVMADAGAIFKLFSAKISVGSEAVDEDLSLASMQVLGTPQAVGANGNPLIQNSGSVYFTSYNDQSLGFDTNSLNTNPAPGQWGGIEFRNDVDNAEGRGNWETEGVFLDYVSHASMTYGGGSLTATTPIVTPIAMYESRPTIIYNSIRESAEAAISADPNSFLESNFHAPIAQRVASFTSDYDRVGPEVTGNVLTDNSINGLFVRVRTPAVGQLEPMTVSGRFDDRDIVHVLSQVLVLQGQPGGPMLLETKPDVQSVTLTGANGGKLTAGQTYDYKLTYVTEEGNESLASSVTVPRTLAAGNGTIILNNLPAAPAEFAGRRLYRLNPASGEYEFVSLLDRVRTSFTDRGTTRGGVLPSSLTGDSVFLPRYNARLSVDPGMVVKMQNSRIEATFGADFYAEGTDGNRIIFTSRKDDTYGAGGTFDTNDDGSTAPVPGEWGGLVFRQGSTGSLDYAEIAYGGGTTAIEGGLTEFNAVEILQADVRIANSTLRRNAGGFKTQSNRAGRGFNDESTIFIRGSQPIIVDNIIRDNLGAALSINPNAFSFIDVLDTGRSTGPSSVVVTDQDNQGPLLSGNELVGNDINAMRVRSEIITTDSVWDDTDLVHVVQGEIHTLTNHFRGSLRLKSDPNQSLVVKFDTNAALIGGGRPLDIEDRIGGTLQVIGTPGNPVVMTSLRDSTVGAGFTPDGRAQNETVVGAPAPAAGNWRGLEIDALANDRNVAYVLENERAVPSAILENASASIFSSELVGTLAKSEYTGDENERLGFNIRGTLSANNDVDVYRFNATGGTQVFIDIDETTFGLDTVVELIDVNDNVLARSDNSFAESTNRGLLYVDTTRFPAANVNPLFRLGDGAVESPNSLDAGMRIVLDGATDKLNTYRIRVSSKNSASSGQYTLSLRLREADEIAGSTVQLADIRYATNAITLAGAPLHSPLTGDATEALNHGTDPFDPTPLAPNSGDEFIRENAQNRLSFNFGQADNLGNLLSTDRGSLVVSGMIGNIANTDQLVRMEDVDVYRVELRAQQIAPDVFDSENRFVTTTFDIDYADGLGRVNTNLAVYDAGGRLILHSRDSNIADDVGRPLKGDDATNLTGGSVGTLDAYIGPVELPEGTYYVAVSSVVAVPAVLGDYFNSTAIASQTRLMPINSVRRIADETFDDGNRFWLPSFDPANPSIDAQGNYTADPSVIEPLFDQGSFVPYNLDDMRLFINIDGGFTGNTRSTIISVNPFTGILERSIGSYGPTTRDIAMRDDGKLFTYSIAPPTGASNGGNVGNFLEVSSVDATLDNKGDDSQTYVRNNTAGADLENDDTDFFLVEALAFRMNDTGFNNARNNGGINNTGGPNGGDRFFAVGSRSGQGRGEVPFELTQNIIYSMKYDNGEATSNGSDLGTADRTFAGTVPYSTNLGPASEEVEIGVIDTGNINNTGGDGGVITGIGYVPFEFSSTDSASNLYAVTDLGGVHLINTNTRLNADPLSPAAGYNRIIPTQFLGMVPIDPVHEQESGLTSPSFSGMTMGPRNIEGQLFRDVIFAVTDDGWLYAISIENGLLVPNNAFLGGRSAIQLTSSFNGVLSPIFASPTGIAFSTLESSPWHVTSDRFSEVGHGTEVPEDRTREGAGGGSSLYYGFETGANGVWDDNTLERSNHNDEGQLAPGGSHGSVISRPFSLEDYSASDKPVLYFSYKLEVEGDDDYNLGNRLQNDAFRVFGAGDDGEWILLATNNNFRDLDFDDEYDYGFDSGIPVQEVFDDVNQWRQSRVEIGPLAGSRNVRIRFDFTTAGSMLFQHDSFEFVATDGDRLRDHEEFSLLDKQTNRTVFFENIIGKDIVVPNGAAINSGDFFTVTGPDGPFTVTFVTTAPVNSGEVQFNSSMTVSQVADAVFASLPKSLSPYRDGADGRISLLAASAVAIGPGSPVAQSNPVQVDQTVTEIVVPIGASVVPNEQITFEGLTTTTTVQLVTAIGTATDPGVIEVLYDTTNSADAIAERILAVLPQELRAINRRDGVISFISRPQITLGGLTSSNVVTNNVSLDENRFAITIPDGDNLINNETITFRSPLGNRTIQFVNGGPIFGNRVLFQAGESSAVIAERLARSLPLHFNAFIDFETSASQVLVNATGVSIPRTGTAITSAHIAALELLMPDGSALTDGEVLTILGVGNPQITFVNATGTAPAGEVYYQGTDTGADLAAKLAGALGVNLDIVVSGPRVLIYGAVDATTIDPSITPNPNAFPPVTNRTQAIAITSSAAQEVVIPSGVALNDGETLTLNTGAGPTVLTFNNSAAAPGPNEINYLTSDSAAVVAAKVIAALPASFNAVLASGTNATLRLSVTSAIAGTTSSLLAIQPRTYTTTTSTTLFIADGAQLVDGETVLIFAGQSQTLVELIFIEVGSSTAPDPFQTAVYFTNGDTAASLYQTILNALPIDMQAFVSIDGSGLSITGEYFSGSSPFVFLQSGNSSFNITTSPINSSSVPLTLPEGARIREFEEIYILRKDDVGGTNRLTFRLVTAANATGGTTEIVYDPLGTAADTAAAVLRRLPIGLQGYLASDQQINLVNALSVTTQANSAIVGFSTNRFNAIPVQLSSVMTSEEVAGRLQVAFAEGFGRLVTVDGSNIADASNFKLYGGDRIRLHQATPVNLGPYGSSYNVPDSPEANFVDYFTALPGDEFGESRSRFVGDTERNSAQNNEVYGIHIDDIIIGFAERGEMVLNAPVNTGFVLDPSALPDNHPQADQPELQNETVVGKYALEIRTADEYGVPEDYDPINLVLATVLSAGRTFDTNDRLDDEAVTLIVQPNVDVLDGDTFVISDGTQRLTFEFNSILDTSVPSVAGGNVPVLFDPSVRNPELIARAIRNAINSQQVQNRFGLTAATGDSREAGTSAGTKIELFGNGITVNPGDGRFFKVDLVAEETFQGRETALTIPVVDHVADTVTESVSPNALARAAVTGYTNGLTDVLVASGKIGDYVSTGEDSGGDDPVIIRYQPQFDTDSVRIYLSAGQSVDIDVDSIDWIRGFDSLDLPVITVFEASLPSNNFSPARLAQTSLHDQSFAPGETSPGAFMTFSATTSGYYDVMISSVNVWSNTSIEISPFATPIFFEGEIFQIDVSGEQSTFQYTTNPNLFSPNRLILLNPADTAEDIATKTAAAIGLYVPSLNPSSEAIIVDIGDGNTNDVILVTTDPFSGLLAVTSRGPDYGEYSLAIRPHAASSAAIPDRDVLMVDYHFGITDKNRVEDQGQLIISSNFISNSANNGVRVIPQRTEVGIPQPGNARLLRNENTDQLVPGAVIANNVIFKSGGDAVLFQGDTPNGNEFAAAVPFGRIYNNTLVGTGGGNGVRVQNSASPTLLNNVFSGFATGISVDDTSRIAGTTEGANVFDNTPQPSNLPALATSSIIIPSGTALFQDPGRDLYIPVKGSQIIDSSFGSLPDRADFFQTVKNAVGISASPIIAPESDAYGQQRVDDPTVGTPSGSGLNPNIDRGAIDRADVVRPKAFLVNPADAVGVVVVGGDTDTDESFVRLTEGTVRFFDVQIRDENGTGPDPATITSESVLLTENGKQLNEGVDYTFGYSANSRSIRLTPLAGVFRSDAVYEITLNNKKRFSLSLPSGNLINDGDQLLIQDSTGAQSILEYESGYVFTVPQGSLISVLGTQSVFQDQQTFSIVNTSTLVSRTFEINTAGSFSSNNVEINLQNATTIEKVRDAIFSALTGIDDTGVTVAEQLGLSPVKVGATELQIGTTAIHSVNGTVLGLNFSGTPGTVAEGDSFAYTSGDQTITFTFTADPLGVLDPTNIVFDVTDTPTVLAEKVVSAFARFPSLGLTSAQAIGNKVLLGGDVSDVLALDLAPSLTLLGTPGVTSSLRLNVPTTASGAALDTTTFSITNGNTSITFQYTTDPTLTSANRLILIGGLATSDQIATATAAAIKTAFGTSLNPVAVGSVVTLGEQNAIPPVGQTRVVTSINVGTSPLVSSGVSGGAIAVNFLPTSQFSKSSTAATVQAAIRASRLDVATFSPGGGTLLIEKANFVRSKQGTGIFVDAGLEIPAIADLAGNPVLETRVNDETRFTIIMPDVVFDLGDAPASYGTLFINNGARHTIGGDRTPRLGQFLDTETNGQPSASADGDDRALTITAIESGGIFDIDASIPNAIVLNVNSTTPASGQTLRITLGGVPTTFELVEATANPAANNVPIRITATDTPAILAQKLLVSIRGALTQSGDALIVSSDGLAGVRLTAVDDEDGLSVGVYNAPSGATLRVFTVPGANLADVDPNDVLGFINPLDPAGTNMSVNVSGGGLLDGWVDFDRDGVFQSDEQILANVPVVNGANTVTFFAPSNIAALGAGTTAMRLRVSDSGNLGPVGVSVGGEVEDYFVSVFPLALPTPVTDTYSAIEDTPLIVDGGSASQQPLTGNDVGLGGQILPVRFFIGQKPAHGTLTVTDETAGLFTYIPDADYYGQDTFTYRLSTQQNNSASAIAASTFATVTINITPVNDAPGAVDATFVTTEEKTLRITAAELLLGAKGHGNPAIDELPFNELNQNVRIVSVTGGRINGDLTTGTTITQSNASTTAITVEGGTLTATFDPSTGSITEVQYTPRENFNSDNLPPALDTLRLDQFLFTVSDDGRLITNSGTVNSTPARVTATVSVRVTPINDLPALTTDLVSISNPVYNSYFTDQGLIPPVPTEDQPLIIPAAFLLLNDLQGPVSAGDENQLIRDNDGTIRLVTPVALVDPTQGAISINPAGDILFTPAPNVFGPVTFTYSVIDQGVDEDELDVRTDNPLTSTVTSTIFVEPINDTPIAFGRNLSVAEAAEPGSPAVLTFRAADLINGKIGEQPARAGAFATPPAAAYNESNQVLRVVSFATSAGSVDVADLAGGNGTLTLTTTIGGTLRFNFTSGAFVDGTYEPPLDYNARAPFNPNDAFTYTIADDGMTVFTDGTPTRDLADARSVLPATVTLTVTPTNDPPIFQSLASVNVLERDDSLSTIVPGFVFNAAAASPTALDELAVQTLSFSIVDSLSNVPAGLMLQTPRVLADGSLEVFPAPDQFGTATYVVRATDAEPNDPAFNDPKSTNKTFTINVRPVNDAPRLNPAALGKSDRVVPAGPNPIIDQKYEVSTSGVITYTLREDNTQPLGVTGVPFFIPITAPTATSGYAQAGLLDVFVPGPANEIANLPGGSQNLELFTFPETTALGGRLESVFQGGVLIGVNYTPPLNYNNRIGGTDTFTYTVRDKSGNGNETWSLTAGNLVPDRLTTTNQVRLDLNPVNDRPEFDIDRTVIEVAEDGPTITLDNFAFNINAGPPFTAFDEIDLGTGQQVSFTVTSPGFSATEAAKFFSEYPSIDPNGRLRFKPAPDAFGTFDFEIVLTDNGTGNATRGDLISSLAKTVTIEIVPTNDPPKINPAVGPLAFTLLEDGQVEIKVRGDSTNPGLLDVFTVGPENEAGTANPGGNQALTLGTPVPATSAAGGTVTQVLAADGSLTALRYKPRANFVGNDSFIYTVTDNGVAVDFGTGGIVRDNPRIASNTVAITVNPVNDAPIFSGAGNETATEDQDNGLGVGVVRSANWATNVQAGPAGALDEIDGLGATAAQQTEFVITQTDGPTSLFSVAPSAIIEGSSATLAYTLAPNANGVAVFTAQLRDNGPNNAAILDKSVGATQTFTITVAPVNDPPSFIRGENVSVGEDSGPYNAAWATQISPGPSDEQDQTVLFSVSVPEASKVLFAGLPEISETGLLRFTPAQNAVGTATITVNAIDSAGAVSLPLTFTISIGEVNDAPRGVNDTLNPSDEDTVLLIPVAQLLSNDTDPDRVTDPNETLTLVMPAESFSVSGASLTYDSVTQTIRYNPLISSSLQALPPGRSVVDSFSYTIRDASGALSTPVIVSININGVNDAPRLVADNPTLASSGSTIISPLENDTDIDGSINRETVRIRLQPAFGSVSIDANGVITYTPSLSFTGEDIFSYSVRDNLGLESEPATITINANPAPIALPDFAGTFIDEAIVVNVASNDSDENGSINNSSIQIVTNPIRGEAIPLADGTIRYVPQSGFVGTDSFTYTIEDNEGRASSPAKVTVQVVASRLQNPSFFTDVNASGEVSALDALLIINRLLLIGNNQSSIPVGPNDRGPLFYDVNGDGVISALDALQVINQLNLRGTVPGTRGSGELIASSGVMTDVLSSMTTETVGVMADPDSAFAKAPRPDKLFAPVTKASVFEDQASLADDNNWLDTDLIEAIANDREIETIEDTSLSAIDSVFGDF